MSVTYTGHRRSAVILLASGLSKRFGAEDKLLARLGETSVINHTLSNIAPVGFDLHVAVIGALSNIDSALRHVLTKAGYDIIVNPLPENGQGSSLALGAEAVLAEGFKRACVALADMPLVPSAHFTNLLDRAETSDQVVSEAQTDSGLITLPPCVFSNAALERLIHAHGDEGAKRYLRGDNVAREKLSNWAAKDIDTLEDLQALERHMKRRDT